MSSSNFSYPNSILIEIYDFLHPGTLEIYADQCNSNPELMRILEPNIIKGVFNLLIGTIYEILYFLCMIVMCQRKFLNNICYRILLVIGFFDMVSLLTNALLPGYFLLTGRSFCTSPLLSLSLVITSLPTWVTNGSLNISLAINRCVDFKWPHLQESIFGGKKILIWTGLPVLHGLFFYFKVTHGFFYTPFACYMFGVDPAKSQIPLIYTVNNIFVVTTIQLLNIWMIRAMFQQSFYKINKLQKMVTIQCLVISTSVLITGWLYVCIQFLPLPMFMITVVNVCWQFSNGSLAIAYLTVNRTTRNEVFKLLKIPFQRNAVYTSNQSEQTPADINKN